MLQNTHLRLIGRAAMAALVVAGLAVAAALLVVPRLTGTRALTVLSGSMTPTYAVGSLVYVTPVADAADSVEAGDVVTFTSPATGGLTTHRVVDRALVEGSVVFTTKGDANDRVDTAPVPAEAVHGVVRYNVPLLGYARAYAATPAGLALAGILACIGLVNRERIPFLRRRSLTTTVIAEPPGSADTTEISDQVTALLNELDAAGRHRDDRLQVNEMPTRPPVADPDQPIALQLLVARVRPHGRDAGDLLRGAISAVGRVATDELGELVVVAEGSPARLDAVARLLHELADTAVVRSAPVLAPSLDEPLCDVASFLEQAR